MNKVSEEVAVRAVEWERVSDANRSAWLGVAVSNVDSIFLPQSTPWGVLRSKTASRDRFRIAMILFGSAPIIVHSRINEADTSSS